MRVTPFKAQISTVLLLGMALAQAGCAGKISRNGSEEVVPLVGTFQVHRYSLKNGLKLLVVEDHSSPTLAYQTWFRVGSRDEVPNYTGLAHLFEHMMFKGTTTHPEGEFDRILEQAGTEGLNAFTSRDYTAYIQELPKDKLDLIASLESDRMVHLVVDEQSFKTETQVVQNERRYRTENNPDGMIEQEIFGLAFKTHPYRWPVVGYQADLERMSGDDARRFYQSYYNPAHATVIVVGDVESEQVLKIVQKNYGSLPTISAPVHILEQEPVQKQPYRKNIKLNIQIEKLMIGFRVPPLVGHEIPALEVMASVLTSGKSSRLHRALVDTGIASSVDSYNPGEKDPSLFLISVNLQKGKRAAQAEEVVRRELLRLQKEPIPEREIERAKNKQSFDFYTGLSSNYQKAKFLGYFETVAGSFEKGIEIRKQIQAVTPAQLQEVARAFFVPNNRTVLTAMPKGAVK